MALYQHGMSLKALLENPELLNPPRKQDDGKDKNKEAGLDFDGGNLFAGQSAFLGPQLWDKTVSYDENDLKLEFMDLDEFLNENCVPDPLAGSPQQQQSPPQLSPSIGIVPAPSQLSPSSPPASPPRALSQLGALLDPTGALALQPQQRSPQLSPLHHMVNPNSLQVSPQRSCPPSPSGSISSNSRDMPPMSNAEGNSSSSDREDFDPRCRSFTEEELRPQPLIKKSRKVFVPEDLKDDKYWARRRKNNVAARRSRDARRTKENQIAMRALFLENQADRLQEELDKALAENEKLRARLAKYEPTA